MSHQIRIASEVVLQNEQEVFDLIQRCALHVLQTEGVDFACEMDITIVDDESIRQVNAEQRGKDSATDVLSFPMYEFYNGQAQEDLEEEVDSACVMLGDMLLNYDRAVQQAQEYGHTTARECGFLTVHSVLHLLGYDHERQDEDRVLMRSKEEQNLTTLGLVRV